MSMGVLGALRGLKDTFDFVLGVFWIGAVPSLFVGLYSCLVVYAMFVAGALDLGLFVWGVPVVMLGPVVVVWYRVLQRRYREYIALLVGSAPFKWDVEAAVDDWVDMVAAAKKKRRKKKG